MQREGFGIRLAAVIVDALILMAVGFVLALVFGGTAMALLSGGAGPGSQATGQAVGFFGALVMLIVGVGYSLTEIFMAGTPGKLALGLMIADERGVPATSEQLAKRWAVKNSGRIIQFLGQLIGVAAIVYLGGIVALVIFIGCFFVLGQARQAFHDKAAGTAVFKKAFVMQTAGGAVPVMAPGTVPPPPPVGAPVPPPPHQA
jgi:uncharacterized RDD family membrane protein YckC